MDFEWLKLSFFIMMESFGNTFLQLFPYAAAGVLLGEILKFTSWTKLIYKAIGSSKLSILPAAILGILSPLCTYGTIPVVITLYRSGVPIGPLISFLSASSLMNPQLFIMTWGGLGLEFALIRLLIVFIFSISVGYITMLIPEKWVIVKNRLLSEKDKEDVINIPAKIFSFNILMKNSLSSMLFVGKYMIIGILLGAFIETFVPKTFIMNTLGGTTVTSILAAALIGIPLYACGGGIIPTVRSMLASGMSNGGAMAFVTVGQGTRFTSLFALAAVLKPVFIVGYCLFLVLFSTLTGLLF